MGKEVQAQNWRQQHHYQQELIAPVLRHVLECLQSQELLLVCKSTEAVDTEQEVSGQGNVYIDV